VFKDKPRQMNTDEGQVVEYSTTLMQNAYGISSDAYDQIGTQIAKNNKTISAKWQIPLCFHW